MKHLRLQGYGGGRWAVLVCENARDIDGEEIGTVTRNEQPTKIGSQSLLLWTARDSEGRNHGDTYLDKWGAARQMALGLGVKVENA